MNGMLYKNDESMMNDKMKTIFFFTSLTSLESKSSCKSLFLQFKSDWSLSC